MGELHDPRAFHPLHKLISDENREIQKSTIISLGEIRNSKALYPLADLLSHQDVEIRRIAIQSLIKFNKSMYVANVLMKVWQQDPIITKEEIFMVLCSLSHRRVAKIFINELDWAYNLSDRTLWSCMTEYLENHIDFLDPKERKSYKLKINIPEN